MEKSTEKTKKENTIVQNLWGEPKCTKGHEDQCQKADKPQCHCSCGGQNHGKKVDKAAPEG